MIRLLRFTWQNILRHKLLTIGAMSVIMLITLFFMVLDTVGFVVNQSVHEASKNIDYTIFLSNDVNVEDTLVLDLKRELELLPATVESISKQKAIRELTESSDLPVYDEMIQFITNYKEDILPPALVVKNISTDDPERINGVLSKSKYKSIVNVTSDASYLSEQKSRLENFLSISMTTNAIFFVLYILFIAISVLIIFNTMSILIFSRAEEIDVMKLVGAKRNFIRFPFFGEAFSYGFVGVILGVGLYALLLWQVDSIVQANLSGVLSEGAVLKNFTTLLAEQLQNSWWVELLKLLAIFTLISLFSSYLALKKYLPKT